VALRAIKNEKGCSGEGVSSREDCRVNDMRGGVSAKNAQELDAEINGEVGEREGQGGSQGKKLYA